MLADEHGSAVIGILLLASLGNLLASAADPWPRQLVPSAPPSLLGSPQDVLWQGGGLLLDHHGTLTLTVPPAS